MPRLRRRSKRRVRVPDELTGWQRFFLNYGPVRMVGADSLARGLWEAFGADLVAEWMEEHAGVRPAGWWAFEAQAELADDSSWRQLEYLHRHGHLTAGERFALSQNEHWLGDVYERLERGRPIFDPPPGAVVA